MHTTPLFVCEERACVYVCVSACVEKAHESFTLSKISHLEN